MSRSELAASPRGRAGAKQARLIILTARVAARRYPDPINAAQHFLRVATRAWPIWRLRGHRTDPARAFISVGMREWRKRTEEAAQ